VVFTNTTAAEDVFNFIDLGTYITSQHQLGTITLLVNISTVHILILLNREYFIVLSWLIVK
jgi:hypothetical protein